MSAVALVSVFYEDLGLRPSDDHSIERRDNNGDYSPENCRWATWAEQNRNTSRNRWVELDGRRECFQDAAARHGLLAPTVRRRLRQGWSSERAFKTPVNQGKTMKTKTSAVAADSFSPVAKNVLGLLRAHATLVVEKMA